MNGFLNLNKPAGITSHDLVARIRRLLGRGTKVGHAGTLDPAATGVLPVALGAATRLIEYLAEAHKGYRALVTLGTTTATDDAEGEILVQRPVPPLAGDMVEAALARFRGPILQVPPIYSALHHQGKRLYELARAGERIELPPRPVTIFRLELLEDRSSTENTLLLDVECSKGTYIRSLARDLGELLGCGAHLGALTRTMVGPFLLEEAITLTTLEQEPGQLAVMLQPPELAVADWPTLMLDEEQARRVRNGMALRVSGPPGAQARAHAPDGALLALLRRTGEEWHPEKVLN